MVPAQLKVRANRENTEDPSQFSLICDPSSRPCLQRNENFLIHAKLKTKKNHKSEKVMNRHTVVLQKISAKMAKYFPLLGGCEQLWPLLPGPEMPLLFFCRSACVQPGRAPRLPRARPKGQPPHHQTRGISRQWSPEEELHDSSPQDQPLPAAFPPWGQWLPGPPASQPSVPLLPLEGNLGGPQLGWPGTPFSLLARSAVHSGSPTHPRGSCCSWRGLGAIWAARAGKK